MIAGVQIIGFLFGLFMIYLTFLYYKRKEYNTKAFGAWMFVWVFFLLIVAFPTMIYGLMETLKVQRTADFFVMAGFLFFALIIFYLFVSVKHMQKNVEKIVRKLAIESER